jgi:hypothetical protein
VLIKRRNGEARRASLAGLAAEAAASTVDRRSFLKRSGLVAGSLAAVGSIQLGAVRRAEAGPVAVDKPRTRIKNMCTHCSVGCSIVAEVQDGVWVGQLVHEALRRWRFPGDAGYDVLMSAAARAAGLIDAEQAEPHMQRAAELLARFRQDPGWIDLNAAQRDGRLRHEIPYMHPTGGAGVMDLLYQDVAGEWQIVDFKTDAVADQEEAEQLILDDYGDQLRRYLRAAAALLGRRARARLCWFDLAGRIQWQEVAEEVPPEPPVM